MMSDSQNREMISQADKYLRDCEQNNHFCLALLQIFAACNDEKAKLQILLHVKNVIKRNWNSTSSSLRSSKGSLLTEEVKTKIKEQLLELYR